MATAAREIVEANTVPVQNGGLIPVIVDLGDAVRIALVRFQAAPEVGERFAYQGLRYEIVRAQDHVRGFVARPVADPAS